MAESLVSYVVSQLTTLLIQEAAFLRGVRDQVEWVKTELQRMESFLRDAESRRRRGDERVENWIREIRDVAYEVEDIIDRVKFMAEKQRQRRGFMGSLSRYYSRKPSELFTLHKIGSEIGKIKEKIRGISESRATYGIANLGESGVGQSSDWDDNLQALRQLPEHYFDDTGVIGLEDDKETLKELLVDPENKNRSVISIVGPGGLGKTTLARKVYNKVKDKFQTSVWLTISQKFDVRAALKDLVKHNIENIKKEEVEEMTEEGLKEKLYNFLQDRRYFVVMDDVWDAVVWERIRQVFPDKNNGSRVLLTTRNIEVAKSIDPSIDPYELHFLNHAESWELFCRKAFPNQDIIPHELEDVGRNLAQKCGGLPLALVVLGGFMSSKERSYATWSEVEKSIKWEFMEDKGKRCLDILALSYNDLPHHLKPCFLYIAAFPEDSIISASRLVRLWTAEGFTTQRPNQTLESTARNCLDELVQRCMIQAVNKSEAYGRIKSIRVHDMLREVGISEARNDRFLHVCSSDDMAGSTCLSIHRAAFHSRMQDEVAVSSPHLRTLLGFNLILKDSTAAGRFLNGLNLLRVLDLEGTWALEELPKEIGSMIHLRYLGLRRTSLQRLPSSIGHLLNLQTLDVRETDISWLPKSFWKIRTLRHVYIDRHAFLSAPISGDHKNLQTLCIRGTQRKEFMHRVRSLGTRFIKNWVAAPGFTKKATEKACERMFAESLEKMNSLVSLSLQLPVQITPGDALLALAPNLHQLRSLTLYVRSFLKQQQQLPDSSQFPPHLTKLVLYNTELEQDPMPVLEQLPNLRLLNLSYMAHTGKSISCSAGGFPQLQHLILCYLEDLEEWRVEVGAMPKLTHLTIQFCRKLKMLPDGLQHVTTLRELELSYMPKEFNDRVRNEVRYIPSIIFTGEGRRDKSVWQFFNRVS